MQATGPMHPSKNEFHRRAPGWNCAARPDRICGRKFKSPPPPFRKGGDFKSGKGGTSNQGESYAGYPDGNRSAVQLIDLLSDLLFVQLAHTGFGDGFDQDDPVGDGPLGNEAAVDKNFEKGLQVLFGDFARLPFF